MIIVALAFSLALNVCFALVVLKITLTGFSQLSESHERTTTYTEGLVDRLMANNYADFKDRELSSQMSAGPRPLNWDDDDDNLESELTPGPDRGGFGSKLGLVALHRRPGSESDLNLEDEIAADRGDV